MARFRKTFSKDEMDDDLLLVLAKVNKAEDWSKHEAILPTSPPCAMSDAISTAGLIVGHPCRGRGT